MTEMLLPIVVVPNLYAIINKDTLQTTSLRRRRCRTNSSISMLITEHYNTLSDTKDKTDNQMYVKESAIKGACMGLFAAHTFNGNDEDSAYIGEYNGGGMLTLDKIHKGGRFNDYILIYKGLIKDAWDHTRGRIQ